jgi:hypothetical protein
MNVYLTILGGLHGVLTLRWHEQAERHEDVELINMKADMYAGILGCPHREALGHPNLALANNHLHITPSIRV